MTDLVYTTAQEKRRLSKRTKQVMVDDSSVYIGGNTNHAQIDEKGVIEAKGDARLWDEISQPFVGKNIFISAGKIDFNFTELTLDFSDSAKYPNHPVGIVTQMHHSRSPDSDIRPHIHWMQHSDAIPNILVEYRWIPNGEVPTSWELKALTEADLKFSYTQDAQQISQFNLPEGHGIGKGLSITFECKIYRDTENTSGLFAGIDTYSGSWDTKYYDIHIRKDSQGSRQEFLK